MRVISALLLQTTCNLTGSSTDPQKETKETKFRWQHHIKCKGQETSCAPVPWSLQITQYSTPQRQHQCQQCSSYRMRCSRLTGQDESRRGTTSTYFDRILDGNCSCEEGTLNNVGQPRWDVSDHSHGPFIRSTRHFYSAPHRGASVQLERNAGGDIQGSTIAERAALELAYAVCGSKISQVADDRALRESGH